MNASNDPDDGKVIPISEQLKLVGAEIEVQMVKLETVLSGRVRFECLKAAMAGACPLYRN